MARGHDPRWKELIRERPLELFGIVDPDLAAHVGSGSPLPLLPTEVFAGGPRGRGGLPLPVPFLRSVAAAGGGLPEEARAARLGVGLAHAARFGDLRNLRGACLARIAGAPGLSDALRFRLFECVANYLELDGGAEEEFEALLPAEAGEETRKMARTLRQVLIEEGRQRGMRDVLGRLLAQRFGPLSPSIASRLEAIHSTEELEGLAERVIQARSLAELGLT